MNANGDDHISFTAMDISLDDSGKYLTVATGSVVSSCLLALMSILRQRPVDYVPTRNHSSGAKLLWLVQ
jgi:hypothetical protein